jgi:hypothetical protein
LSVADPGRFKMFGEFASVGFGAALVNPILFR